MFLKEKIKRILNRQPEMIEIFHPPLSPFIKTNNGSELLIDIVALKDIKKYLAGKAVHTLTYYDITFITEGEGRFVIGHQTYNAVSRDVFFSRPGEIRSWEINCIKNGYALIFEDEFLSSFFKDTQFVQHLSYFHPGGTSLKLQLPEELYIRMLQLLQHIKKEIDTYQPGNVHILRHFCMKPYVIGSLLSKNSFCHRKRNPNRFQRKQQSLHRAVYKTGGRELERAAFRAILCRLP